MEIHDFIDSSHWPRVSELFEAVGWGLVITHKLPIQITPANRSPASSDCIF